MPTGPNGEWRPADVVGCAVTVMRIATGEIDEAAVKAQAEHPVVAESGALARAANRRAGAREKAASIASRIKALFHDMGRDVFMLAAMCPAGSGSFSPVQVQKLFFLVNENVAKQAGRSYFDFQPYDYGPFDKEVYRELEQLDERGLVEITNPDSRGNRAYRLTNEGSRAAREAFDGLEEPIQNYIGETVEFVRNVPFDELVSAIYQAYPDMKKNSVFA